ncbi:MAG: M28 family metallopeptidase [Gemmatimonadales bacterium]
MHRTPLFLILLLVSTTRLDAQGTEDRTAASLRGIADAVSSARLESTVRTLVGFGTRHTLSDTLSATRGIGAARRWVRAEFERISAGCGGCLEVIDVSEVFTGLPRVPGPTSVVNIVAIQRGSTDPNRYVLLSGDIDSRVSDIMNATDSSPGANDNASGVAAVLEAARVLSGHRFRGSIVYAALSGEENGLLGGQTLAAKAMEDDWRLTAVINNDMIGNVNGGDGIHDTTTVRVFSEGTSPIETDSARRARRYTGGEVDGASRQLARYIKATAGVVLPELDVWLIYRLDRFGRGGHHRPFADLGYPAVRLMEAHENYTRQHQDIRVEDGVAYGDVIEGIDFNYARRITALDAAVLASLSWAPEAPRQVRLRGAVQPAATLSWKPPADSAAVAGYRVYWRRTDAATWDHWEDVGMTTSHRFDGLVVDNWFFGVASVSPEGYTSVVAFPGGS